MATPPSRDAAFQIECRAGRLIEARVFRLRDPGEADRYAEELAAQVSRTPPTQRPILCADHRPVAVYTQSVADRLGELVASELVRLRAFVSEWQK